jgi:ABC-type Fe3+-hydroxamate transport system substrate-binding protein
MEYNKAVKAVQDKVAELVERNNKAREEYSSKNDKVSTAYIYQHMIGTPDQIYIPGQDSYNGNAVMEYYKGLYKTTDDVEVKATVVKSISNEDAKEDTKKAVLSSYRAMSASNKALAAFLDQVIDINVMLGNC